MLKFIIQKLRLDHLIKYLRGNSVLFAKYYTYYILNKHARKKAILIYNMGKVGSMTVYSSLNEQLEEYSVYHVHWLSEKNLDKDLNFMKKFNKRLRRKGINKDDIFDYIIRGYYINKKIKSDKNNNFKIYTLTRDPIARNISSFFQNLQEFFCYEINKKLAESSEESVVNELIDLFLNEFIVKNKINFIDSDPTTWFDEELKSVFNIDVYKSQFPKEKGYKIYSNNSVSVLLIRLEDLNDCFTEATEKFLAKNLHIIELKNTARDKAYSSVYKKFKARITFPDWYLDEMYESKYVKHFYTEDEIMAFKNKWTGELSPG